MKRLMVLPLVALAGAASAPATFADGPGADDELRAGSAATFLQSQRVSGALRADYFHSSKNLDDETGFLGATVQLKALPELTGIIDGKLEARVTKSALDDDGDSRARLLEAYVILRLAKADFRLGRQIVAWGRADGINPTDNLTPRDYTVLLPFEDDQRFGTTAIKFDAYLSESHTFTVFATPLFEPSGIPRPASAGVFVETTPARTISNGEIGLKLNKIGEGLDWSASYFHGFSLLPDLRVLGGTVANPVLESHYDPIDAFGADFARNIGRFGFRGELAYIDTADDSGLDPGVKNPYLFWIIGIDRTIFDNLNVNLQFFQRRVWRYHNPEDIADELERSIAVQNAILDGQRDRISNGISFRVSNKWRNETLVAEIFAVVNFTRHDSYVRPVLTYAFSDHWKGSLGGDFYHGRMDTQFGSLKTNSGAFAELRYGF